MSRRSSMRWPWLWNICLSPLDEEKQLKRHQVAEHEQEEDMKQQNDCPASQIADG